MSTIREFKINTNHNLSGAIYLLNPLIFFLDITILKAADFLSKIKRKRSNSVVEPKNPPSPIVVYHSRRVTCTARTISQEIHEAAKADDEKRPARNIRRVSGRVDVCVGHEGVEETRFSRVRLGASGEMCLAKFHGSSSMETRFPLPCQDIDSPWRGPPEVFSSSPARGDFLKSLSKSKGSATDRPKRGKE